MKAGTKPGAQAPIGGPSNKVGFAAGSGYGQLSQAELSKRFADMRALGAAWVRFDIEWNNIENAGPGQYNWAPYDRLVTTANAQGLKVLGIIGYTPPWARKAECKDDSMCAPANVADFARFAGAAAGHYRPLGVSAWEIWNEPNTANHFAPAADPALYTAMLAGAYGSIKAANPAAIVITGGTAPTDTESGYISPVDFASGIYANGAGKYFDAFGAHPYTYPVTPTYPNAGNAWGQLAKIRSIMVANGDSRKSIWATEFGAPTGGPGPLATQNAYLPGAFKVSEALQSLMVSDAFASLKLKPYVANIFWYSYQDAGTSPNDNENFFGLLRADGSRKPAYNTFAAGSRSF